VSAFAAAVPLGSVISGQTWVQPLLAVQVIFPPLTIRRSHCPMSWLRSLTKTTPAGGHGGGRAENHAAVQQAKAQRMTTSVADEVLSR
jgi:hypothetical protein